MAIVNSVATYSGQGYEYQSAINTIVTTSGSPQTVRVPAGSVVFSPAVNRGLFRVKIYNFTSAVNFTNLSVYAADGTNTIWMKAYAPIAAVAITATAWVDVLDDYLIDYTTAGGGATGGLIAFGATFFNFIFNVATGSGSCSADIEIVGAP